MSTIINEKIRTVGHTGIARENLASQDAIEREPCVWSEISLQNVVFYRIRGDATIHTVREFYPYTRDATSNEGITDYFREFYPYKRDATEIEHIRSIRYE